jgi:hypothetical protein
MRPTAIIIFTVVSSLFAIQTNASAQIAGNVSGVVKEKSGSVLPGVTVEVENSTLIERPRGTVADSMGQFQLSDLPPGIYTATFSLPGFRTVKHEGVEVLAGSTTIVNVEMSVGAITETTIVVHRAKVICGLTVVPADPSIDSNIQVPAGSPDADPWLRTTTPAVCRQN